MAALTCPESQAPDWESPTICVQLSPHNDRRSSLTSCAKSVNLWSDGHFLYIISLNLHRTTLFGIQRPSQLTYVRNVINWFIIYLRPLCSQSQSSSLVLSSPCFRRTHPFDYVSHFRCNWIWQIVIIDGDDRHVETLSFQQSACGTCSKCVHSFEPQQIHARVQALASQNPLSSFCPCSGHGRKTFARDAKRGMRFVWNIFFRSCTGCLLG